MLIEKIISLLIGVFCIVCAATEQKFFFDNYKAKPIMKLFGRNGAKIFFILLGAVIIYISIFKL